MDLELLFSNQVSDYITEVNKKYPDISSSEFCKMVEEFAEKNKANIIEEAIDMDEFDEPTDKPSPSDADEEDIDKEPESDGEPSGEPSGEPESKEEKQRLQRLKKQSEERLLLNQLKRVVKKKR